MRRSGCFVLTLWRPPKRTDRMIRRRSRMKLAQGGGRRFTTTEGASRESLEV
jgi:hypothetical protein